MLPDGDERGSKNLVADAVSGRDDADDPRVVIGAGDGHGRDRFVQLRIEDRAEAVDALDAEPVEFGQKLLADDIDAL